MTMLSWLFLLVLPLPISGCDDVSAEVQEVFDQYTTAYANGDAEAVLRLIDPKNIESYDQLAESARSATTMQIMRMQPLNKMMIAFLRAALKPEELKALDGRKLVRLMVQARPGRRGGGELTLRNIRHRAPRATAEILIDEFETGINVEFVQIGENWHVNDECHDALMNRLILEIGKLMNKSEDAVVLDFASGMAGKPIYTHIWAAPPK
jgi:hypothetical protein